MSDFIEKGNREDHTEAVQGHILHGKAPEAHPSMALATNGGLPKRTGYPATADGKGTEYMPPQDAGHKAP